MVNLAGYLVLCTLGTSLVVDPGNNGYSPLESNSVLTLCKEVEDDIQSFITISFLKYG